jgi:neurotransmitter:Na+ symporter, NSS family
MSNPNPKERWETKLGVILVVASSAIGLGNFLRFPGQAVKNGGGAFMIPYIISFILLGLPVCISEWVLGRMGNRNGHSTPNILRNFLTGVPLRITSTIALIIPTAIYTYYVFIEAWCLSYAIDFLLGNINLANAGASPDAIVAKSGEFFTSLTGAHHNGQSFESKILPYLLLCYILNFFLIFRGLSKGIESLARKAVPVLFICGTLVLFRVLTLDGIEKGLGEMWNPRWESLLNGKVWIEAAGQIFFSLSVGFGIVLSFSSYLTKKDDVVLSGVTAASVNEFMEVVFGGLITIPIAFLFIGASVTQYGTFGIGFIALPSVFAMMPGGQIFGAIWFFVLFVAAITSSVSMVQPGITFLEEAFHLRRRTSVLYLFSFTVVFTLLITYFNKDFISLDLTDFWIGTFFIYILATIQVLIYGWKIGPKAGRESGEEGSQLHLPRIFDFIIKYITPVFLFTIFAVFAYQSLPEYFNKMSVSYAISEAAKNGKPEVGEISNALTARWVFISILLCFGFFYYLVSVGLKNIERREEHESDLGK